MLDKDLRDYFDGIEPDNELVERMIAMSNQSNKKRMKLSTRIIAVLAAVICVIGATTATAAILRINNDKNGIVNEGASSSFVLDFTKAQRSPQKLSETDNDIVKALEEKGIRDVVIPSALINDGYRVDSAISFLPQYTSAMFDFSNDTDITVSLSVVQDIAEEDVAGFWGTGDENSMGEVINVNGMDVVVVYMGDGQIGYSSIIFYANANTIYQYTLNTGLDEQQRKEITYDFVNSLAQ